MKLSKVLAYQLWGLGVKIIDPSLIFSVLETQSQNLGLCQNDENRLGINYFDVHTPKTICSLFI